MQESLEADSTSNPGLLTSEETKHTRAELRYNASTIALASVGRELLIASNIVQASMEDYDREEVDGILNHARSMGAIVAGRVMQKV